MLFRIFGERINSLRTPFRRTNIGINEAHNDKENLRLYRYIMNIYWQQVLDKSNPLNEKFDYDMFTIWGQKGNYFTPLLGLATFSMGLYFNKSNLFKYD